MIKIQKFFNEYLLLRDKITFLNQKFIQIRNNLLDISLKTIFDQLELQNQLVIEIGNYCNKLLKYIKGEERTINNSSNSVKNLGIDLPYELQTSNFISIGNNKNIFENIIRNSYKNKKNKNKSLNEKSFSSINLFTKESKENNTIGSNTSREKYSIKPSFFTKKLMNKQYKILNNFNNNETISKNNETLSKKSQKEKSIEEDFFNN
jgi:hypothetical protein